MCLNLCWTSFMVCILPLDLDLIGRFWLGQNIQDFLAPDFWYFGQIGFHIILDCLVTVQYSLDSIWYILPYFGVWSGCLDLFLEEFQQFVTAFLLLVWWRLPKLLKLEPFLMRSYKLSGTYWLGLTLHLPLLLLPLPLISLLTQVYMLVLLLTLAFLLGMDNRF